MISRDDTSSQDYLDPATSAVEDLTAAVAAIALSGQGCTEALRLAVVRYASEARAQAVAPDEVVNALFFRLRHLLDRLAAGLRDEVMACMRWWAAHGYFRAD
jgi:hypothetical protein